MNLSNTEKRFVGLTSHTHAEIAFELGYRACKRGEDILKALNDFRCQQANATSIHRNISRKIIHKHGRKDELRDLISYPTIF